MKTQVPKHQNQVIQKLFTKISFFDNRLAVNRLDFLLNISKSEI